MDIKSGELNIIIGRRQHSAQNRGKTEARQNLKGCGGG